MEDNTTDLELRISLPDLDGTISYRYICDNDCVWYT